MVVVLLDVGPSLLGFLPPEFYRKFGDTFEPVPEIDIIAVQKEIIEIEAKLAKTRKIMDGYLKKLGFI